VKCQRVEVSASPLGTCHAMALCTAMPAYRPTPTCRIKEARSKKVMKSNIIAGALRGDLATGCKPKLWFYVVEFIDRLLVVPPVRGNKVSPGIWFCFHLTQKGDCLCMAVVNLNVFVTGNTLKR